MGIAGANPGSVSDHRATARAQNWRSGTAFKESRPPSTVTNIRRSGRMAVRLNGTFYVLSPALARAARR